MGRCIPSKQRRLMRARYALGAVRKGSIAARSPFAGSVLLHCRASPLSTEAATSRASAFDPLRTFGWPWSADLQSLGTKGRRVSRAGRRDRSTAVLRPADPRRNPNGPMRRKLVRSSQSPLAPDIVSRASSQCQVNLTNAEMLRRRQGCRRCDGSGPLSTQNGHST